MTDADPNDLDARDRGAREAARRRLRGFGLHLLGYLATMAVLVPINFVVSPRTPWFVLPMVGWGSVLALHAAYAMDLFRGLLGRTKR